MLPSSNIERAPRADVAADRMRVALETVAVVAVLHLYTLLWRPSRVADVAACVAVGAVAAWRMWRRGEGPRAIGLIPGRRDLRAARALAPGAALTLVALLAVGWWRHPETFGARLGVVPKLFALYVWGALAQQAFYLGFVLRGARLAGLSRAAAVVVAAAAFGAVHLPNLPLAALTFPFGLFAGWIYSATPSLVPIAVAHAGLAAVVQCVVGLPMAVGARYVGG